MAVGRAPKEFKIGVDLTKTGCKVLSPKCVQKAALTHIFIYLFMLYCFLFTCNWIFGLEIPGSFHPWQQILAGSHLLSADILAGQSKVASKISKWQDHNFTCPAFVEPWQSVETMAVSRHYGSWSKLWKLVDTFAVGGNYKSRWTLWPSGETISVGGNKGSWWKLQLLVDIMALGENYDSWLTLCQSVERMAVYGHYGIW